MNLDGCHDRVLGFARRGRRSSERERRSDENEMLKVASFYIEISFYKDVDFS